MSAHFNPPNTTATKALATKASTADRDAPMDVDAAIADNSKARVPNDTDSKPRAAILASDILDGEGRCVTCHCRPGRTGLRVPTRYGVRLSPKHHPSNSPPNHNYRGDRLPHPDELKAPPEVSGMRTYHMAIPLGVKAGVLTFWVSVDQPWPFWMMPGWHEDFETARYIYNCHYNAGTAAILSIKPYDATKTGLGPRHPPGLPLPPSVVVKAGALRQNAASSQQLPLVAAPSDTAEVAGEVRAAIASTIAGPSSSTPPTHALDNNAASTSSTKNVPPSSATQQTPAATATSSTSAPKPTACKPAGTLAASTSTAASSSQILAGLDAARILDTAPKRKRALDPYRPGKAFELAMYRLPPPAFKTPKTPSHAGGPDDDYVPTSPSPHPGSQSTLSPYLGLPASPTQPFPPAQASASTRRAGVKVDKGKGKASNRRPRRVAGNAALAAISSTAALEREEEEEEEQRTPTPPKKRKLAASKKAGTRKATPAPPQGSPPPPLYDSDSSPEPRSTVPPIATLDPFIKVEPETQPGIPSGTNDQLLFPDARVFLRLNNEYAQLAASIDADLESPSSASSVSFPSTSSPSNAGSVIFNRAVIDLSDDEDTTRAHVTPTPRGRSAASSAYSLVAPPSESKANSAGL